MIKFNRFLKNKLDVCLYDLAIDSIKTYNWYLLISNPFLLLYNSALPSVELITADRKYYNYLSWPYILNLQRLMLLSIYVIISSIACRLMPVMTGHPQRLKPKFLTWFRWTLSFLIQGQSVWYVTHSILTSHYYYGIMFWVTGFKWLFVGNWWNWWSSWWWQRRSGCNIKDGDLYFSWPNILYQL